MTELPASPTPPEVAQSNTPARGHLKVYLGATPGSGKTFAMLREGRDRRDDGEDVAIGLVEAHGRARTLEAIGTLEVIPRVPINYRGTVLEDMDLDAVLRRHPQLALVDELAHTDAPGLLHEKRWQDIEDIRDAGIDVITTLNIQHLESISDLVERITGVRVQETVPDSVLDAADEIQFIDITPEALRKRMRHGNVYARDRVDTALDSFFRIGNLAALREIGLRFVAERVGYERGGIQSPPEDVLVAVGGGAMAEDLIRRAVRIARRHRGQCVVFHVHDHVVGDGTVDEPWRRLADELGCIVVLRDPTSVAAALIAVARERMIRHIVLGAPRPRRAAALRRSGIVDQVLDSLADVDVHVVGRGRQTFAPLERPDPETLLERINQKTGLRGSLRLYLGYARGCGATRAMLDEASRRHRRGRDVVVASVGDKQRAHLGDLVLLGGADSPAARGVVDLAAVLARNPEVVAVDDLAGPTTTGERVVDVIPRIRAAGITVIGTIHLIDVRSTVEAMGDLLGRSSSAPMVDDGSLDAADEIELVDVVPAVVEERLRHGDIVPPHMAIKLLQTEFRPDVLAMLRELAFRRVAQHTDRALLSYMSSEHIQRSWEARPRVLICVPPRSGHERLIERAAKLATSRDDALTALSVRHGSYSENQKQLLGAYAALTHQLGGEFVSVYDHDVAHAIVAYAREHRITEIMAMRSHHNRHSGTLRRLISTLTEVNVHILAGPEA